MQNGNRFVPMIDVRPDAAVFGSSFRVDMSMLMHKSFAAEHDRIVTDGLLRGIEAELRRMILSDPKRAAEILDLKAISTPSRDHNTEYQLRFAVMHPAKLRELENAGLDREEHVRASTKLAQTVTELRRELEVAKLKATRYDQLMADIAAATTQPVLDNCGNPADF